MHFSLVLLGFVGAIALVGVGRRAFSPESRAARVFVWANRILGGVVFLGGVCLLGVGGWLLFQHDTNWSLGPLILGVLFIAVGVWGLGVLSSRSGTLNDP